MGIVGHHQGKIQFPGKAHNSLIYSTLLRDAVVLKFQIKVVLPENILQFQSIGTGGIVVLLKQVLSNGTCQAGRQGNQSLMTLPQELQVHPGLSVEAFEISLGNQVAKIFVAGSVLAQQHKMVGFVIHAVDSVLHPPPGYINLTADDGLDSRLFCLFIKIDTAVHHPMIRQGDGILAQLLHPVHHGADAAGAVQKTVFRVDMQMHKTHGVASVASCISFFRR